MANDSRRNSRSRAFGPLVDIGGRAASVTLRPLTGAVGAAAEAGIGLERRAVDRFLESGDLERLLASARLQTIVAQVVRTDGAAQLADTLADSGLVNRFVERLLSADNATQLIDTLVDSGVVNRFVERLLASESATQLVDTVFDSGLFDRLVDRLLSSDGLWRIVDEVASSPAVRAALSQQGLGFADQVGDAVRERSRDADRRLERVAQRLMRRGPGESRDTPTQGGED